MTKRNQLASIFGGLLLGLSSFSVSYAQDVESYRAPVIAPTPQSDLGAAPISLAATAPSLSPSWQGQARALGGHDVVSYFTEDRPVIGSQDHRAHFDGTTWHFASKENRDLFVTNPRKYVPAFGGYSPVGLAKKYKKVGHPQHYTVHEENLYLNYDGLSHDTFKDVPRVHIEGALVHF